MKSSPHSQRQKADAKPESLLRFTLNFGILAVLCGAGLGTAFTFYEQSQSTTAPWPASASAAPVDHVQAAVAPLDRRQAILAKLPPNHRFAGCNEVRALGIAPLERGEPGYSEDMDGDNDGLACEPIRE